jgi:hypothetical protein
LRTTELGDEEYDYSDFGIAEGFAEASQKASYGERRRATRDGAANPTKGACPGG